MLCFIFPIGEISQMLWKIFLILSLYILEKTISLLTNIRNKGVIRRINLCFLTSWKMVIFFLQKFIILNMITDFLLVEKWRTLEHAKRYVCKNFLKLDCRDIICFAFCLKMKNHLGRVFLSHSLQNVLIETSNVSYFVLCHFLTSWRLKIANTLKDIFSITFFNSN